VTDPPGSPGPSGLPVGDLPTTGPPTVALPVPARALAIGAHPDDIEFGCGATLARWAAAGCRVHHLVLTDGSKGSWDPDADLAALVVAREAECRAAAAVLDGLPGGQDGGDADRVRFLRRIDGELVDDADGRRQVARVIREVRPTVVLGHDPWRRYRLHPDHRHAGFLALGALVAARDPHFFPELGLAPHRPEHLLLWEPDLPNHVEPATGFAALKVEALLIHASQQRSTMGIDDGGTDSQRVAFADKVAHQLAAHGAVAGLPSGEAFHRLSDL
jgi:LmbE family N-acetylglucosaminyl deacetylase